MGCLDIVRIILATINVIINGIGVLYGVALVAQGIAFLVLFNIFGIVTDDSRFYLYNAIFAIFITIGVVLIVFSVVAIAGSCMACCPNNTCLKVLASVILIIDLVVITLVFLLAVASIIIVFVYSDILTDNFNTLRFHLE
ncbi:hypothetical protein LOD99_5937 [Oopsacas minuta]|uniref:Uncharacterized protein n=1 Tax=Oopsacas minuta TaxID=111878 RepID=A0AAV7JNI2_9METZ|nr:hypothetical protein LOD99_5937 [Oopsacas minuta]